MRLQYEHQRPNRTMTIKGVGKVKLSAEQYSILEGMSGYQFHQLGHEMINSSTFRALKRNGDTTGMKEL